MRFERGTLNDIFNNYIVFRELNPINKSLPSFEEIKAKLHLESLPRKKDKEYALVLKEILKSALSFSNIIYIGDTFLSDLTVVENLKDLGIDVFGVITDESVSETSSPHDYIVFNNSWSRLEEIVLDKIREKTILLVDIDKTAIGAHGRNHLPIDKARTDAIVSLAENVFMRNFHESEKENFLKLYKSIHTKELLNFTQDNQDIVSIVTLIIYSGILSLQEFYKASRENTFEEFVENISVPENLGNLIHEVKENLKQKSPTLFPTFRKIELEKTIARMDFLPDETPLQIIFNEEILITGEVYRIGKYALSKGAVVFGVSDKPEIASFNEKFAIFTKEMKIYP